MDEIKLVSVDSKNKVRLVKLYWEKENTDYLLKKETGVWNGKMILQPVHRISCGKVKRTIEEQRDLEFNSMLKKYLDKGYKKLDDLELPANYTENDIIGLIGSATDSNGVPKPMLCKIYEKDDSKNEGKSWYLSAKHDGLRCFLYYKDGKIKTASRGGQNYDVAATYICQDPHVVEIFKKFPDIILDGELYYHHKDWNLQKISGLGRLETLDPDHKFLNFHCYDLVDETKTFKDRWKFLQSLKKDNSKLVIVKHHNVTTHEEIMELHNYYVAHGYEGAVIRDADAVYKPSSRSRIMQKIKIFQDDEFVITGITEGLRDEDFVFNLVTADGKPFEAKPTGTREERQEYRDNIDNIIGKKGTVKYFGFTPDGIPNLPVFRAVVNEKDR